LPGPEGGFKLVPLHRDVRALKGRFAGRVTQTVTLEQMDEAILNSAGGSEEG